MNKRELTAYAAVLIMSMVPAVPLCHMLESAPVLDALCLHSGADPVKYAESVPQTSATILGLAIFGFLLGVRLNMPHVRAQLRYVGPAAAAIAVATALQACLMVYAQVWEVYAPFYAYAMATTGAALIVVGGCFVMATEAGRRLGDMESRNSDDVDRHASELQDRGAANGGNARVPGVEGRSSATESGSGLSNNCHDSSACGRPSRTGP